MEFGLAVLFEMVGEADRLNLMTVASLEEDLVGLGALVFVDFSEGENIITQPFNKLLF